MRRVGRFHRGCQLRDDITMLRGYVMLFAMTLGTYSIIPSIYLWREVSKPLAVLLKAAPRV